MSRFMHTEERVQTEQGEFVVRTIDRDNQVVELFDPSSGALTKITLPAMRRQISDGSMRRLAKRPSSAIAHDLAKSECACRQHMFNLLRIRKLESYMQRGDGRAEAIRKLLKETLTLDDGTCVPAISERQAYRLIHAAAHSPLELIPAYADRGNRTVRHPEAVNNLIRDLIDEAYAKVHSRITMRALAQLATTFARERGLIDTTRKISRAYVKSIFLRYFAADLDYKRVDPRIARSKKHVAQERIVVEAALQRVEQDTVVLPFLVQTTEGPLQNPYMTMSIDCGTGVPLGWHLSTTPVTEEETLDCLETSLYSKADRFKQLSINCDIDPYGLFANLYLDNGAENKGERITRLAEIGLPLTRTAAHSGHRKPFIERFFGSLKSALEGLPGCTRHNGKDGTRTEVAAKENLMTIDELERWIVRWAYEQWIHTVLDRLLSADYKLDEAPGITPATRWKYYEQATCLPCPPDRTDWIRVRYLRNERGLSPKTGLSIEGFRFRGENLRRLVGQYGPDSKVMAYYNPSDYRFAYVADKETGQLLSLVNAEVGPNTPAFSFSEAKKRRAHVRKVAPAAPACVASFQLDLANASLSGKRRKKGHAEKQREVRQASKLNKAIKKSRAHPAPPNPETDIQTMDNAEVFLTDDAIPTFEIETKPSKPNGGMAS